MKKCQVPVVYNFFVLRFDMVTGINAVTFSNMYWSTCTDVWTVTLIVVCLMCTNEFAEAEILKVQWAGLEHSFRDDFVTIDMHSSGEAINWSRKEFTVNNPPRRVTGFVAISENPNHVHFSLPSVGCGHRVNTSVTAEENNCTYATNAGFFDMRTGDCMGNLVANRREIQLVGLERVNFGIISSQFVIGYLNLTSLQSLPPFSELISGAGWLVRDSKSYVSVSRVKEDIGDGFVTEKAPRTGLGLLPSGQVVALQVDGIEDEKKGVDLYEFADCFTSLGAVHAVNLDGGGSSASWAAGHGIVDHPTCADTPVECERAVTSIMCMRSA